MDVFGSCCTLEPPRTQQQPRPDPGSDYPAATSSPPHHLHYTDNVKCRRLFEMPPAVLTSEPLLTGSEYSMYIHANKSTAEESTGALR